MADLKITIYTDGAARGNPGRGGFGVIMMAGKHRKEISGGYRLTTNNRMELLAVITALEAVKNRNLPIEVFTDSKYVCDSINKKWLNKWVATDFKGGKKNKDLWMRYYRLSSNFNIKINWVKGHAANPFNNRCDFLATSAADGEHLLIDENFEMTYQKV